MRRLLAAAAFAFAFAPRVAEAAPSAHLVYARSPDAADCPDETALRNAVAARIGYDPFFAWAKRTVLVEVRREGERYASRVQILDAAGVSGGVRELSSSRSSCAELFDATALAISIALDAADRASASAAAPPAPPAPPPAPSSPPPPAASTASTPSPEPALDGDEIPVPLPPPGTRTSLGVAFVGSTGTAPKVAAGLALSGDVRVGAFSAGLEARADAPAGTSDSEGAGTSSWLYAASAVPCLHADPVAFCAVGSLGQFVASGTGVRSPATGTALYAAAGARIGVEWSLSPAWSLRTHLDGLFDLDRPTYSIDGTDTWPAPLLAFSLAVGVAARIP
ncbi:MAG TPA: hypothetical protein VIY73_16150 [Polyangiaceae bacterium]